MGESEDGQTTQENYTVYVTISDGKDPDEKETQETQAPVFQPKLVVKSYKCSVEQILDGDSFDITVTLRNMSDSDAIRDLTVRTGAAAEQFELTGESDSAQQEQPDEPSQWWWIIGILALVIILIGSAILMQYMNKKRKIKNLKEECNNVIENEKYIYNRIVIGYVRFDFDELNRLIYDENCVN